MPDILKQRKIAVLGSRSVGKSSLVIKFVDNNFVDSYHPTIESTFNKDVNYRGVEYQCEIIDTAGQDEYSILNSRHAIGIHGFVLVYSVANRLSFDIIQIIHEKILNFGGKETIPCVVVGAKADLPIRQVADEEAKDFAESVGASWVETSAKSNINVGKVFDLCLSEIERHAPGNQALPPVNRCIIM